MTANLCGCGATLLGGAFSDQCHACYVRGGLRALAEQQAKAASHALAMQGIPGILSAVDGMVPTATNEHLFGGAAIVPGSSRRPLPPKADIIADSMARDAQADPESFARVKAKEQRRLMDWAISQGCPTGEVLLDWVTRQKVASPDFVAARLDEMRLAARDFTKVADQRKLLARALPILADLAHHPEVAKLCREIRDLDAPPADPMPKSVTTADVILGHVLRSKEFR